MFVCVETREQTETIRSTEPMTWNEFSKKGFFFSKTIFFVLCYCKRHTEKERDADARKQNNNKKFQSMLISVRYVLKAICVHGNDIVQLKSW